MTPFDPTTASDDLIRAHVRGCWWPEPRWSVRIGNVLVEFPGIVHTDGDLSGIHTDRYELRNLDGSPFDGGMLDREVHLVQPRDAWLLGFACLAAHYRELCRENKESQ